MTVTITALDGSGDTIEPIAVLSDDTSSDTANVENTLIDGSVAVTLVGEQPAQGTLTLFYNADVDVTAARELLSRPTTFELVDTSRGIVDMTFARQGTMTPGMSSEARYAWEFQVGYRQVTA